MVINGRLDLNITPQSNFYKIIQHLMSIKTTHIQNILANAISFVGEEDLEGDGDNDIPIEDDKLRIFYDIIKL